jgi:putative phosphoesterase
MSDDRIGLISDPHGDPEALELALSHLRALGVDHVLCAGDVVGYGPDPDDAAAFLREHSIPTVRGNHDRWALERGPGVPDEFGGAIPSAETLAFLSTLEPSIVTEAAGRILTIVHGSPRGDMEFVSPATHPGEVLSGYLGMLKIDLLVVGHTHRPMCYRDRLGLVVNPGSLVAKGRVESSRSFCVVDLTTLDCQFFRADTGKALEVPPWPASRPEPTMASRLLF